MRNMILLLLALVLAACGTTPEELPDPLTLIQEAGEEFHNAETFRIEMWREGAPYYIDSDVIDGALIFDRANMDYVAPDVLQGQVKAKLAGLPFTLNIMARGDLQWVQLPGTIWTDELYFAPGFNPELLIAEESGFQAALDALLDLEIVGRESLEDGTPVYHLTGRADGPAVTDLLVGMIVAENEVLLDVFVHAETRMPVRLVITMPETATDDEPEPTAWWIDVYDFNEELEITGPGGEGA